MCVWNRRHQHNKRRRESFVEPIVMISYKIIYTINNTSNISYKIIYKKIIRERLINERIHNMIIVIYTLSDTNTLSNNNYNTLYYYADNNDTHLETILQKLQINGNDNTLTRR
jgi:hypothetical protein